MNCKLIHPFAKCLQRSFRVTSCANSYLTLPFSTCSTRGEEWLRKTTLKLDFSKNYGALHFVSCVPVRSMQTDKNSEQLIYKGEIQNSVKRLKILTLSTSIGGFCVQPSVLSKLWETSPYLAYSLGIISTLFIVATPLLVHFFTRRYVTELYFNPETKIFTAATLTIFIRKKKTTFTADDVYVPAVPGLFTSFLVGNTPMFVNSESVIDIEAYQHLLGYDKPMDFYFHKSSEKKRNGS